MSQIEPNSKPLLLKRIAADGFDITMIFILFMLLTYLLVNSSLGNIYRQHFDHYRTIEAQAIQQYDNDAASISSYLNSNEEYQNELFAANLHSFLLKGLAALISEAIVLLVIPLTNSFRCSPGKLMTGIIPFDERGQMKARSFQIILRFVYIYLIDSLAVYMFTGIFTFLLVPLIRLIEILTNKKGKTVIDYMTGLMIIEKLSYDGIN